MSLLTFQEPENKGRVVLSKYGRKGNHLKRRAIGFLTRWLLLCPILRFSHTHTKWLDPKSVIKKLENWRDKGTVLNLIISAGGGINVDVTINSFEYKKFGGKGDYSYSISFYRYRPLKIQTTKDLGIDKKKKKTTTRTNLKKSSTDKKKQTYTIKSGDCLWNIAKKFYGSGADWKKIYDANKTAIEKAAKKYGHKDSDQGDWIFPGTILTIP